LYMHMIISNGEGHANILIWTFGSFSKTWNLIW
jgi:hypothetical protein